MEAVALDGDLDTEVLEVDDKANTASVAMRFIMLGRRSRQKAEHNARPLSFHVKRR
jgi:hypothetical protein